MTPGVGSPAVPRRSAGWLLTCEGDSRRLDSANADVTDRRGHRDHRAEIEDAITHEGALDVTNVRDRGTRIGLVADDADRVREAVAETLAELADRSA